MKNHITKSQGSLSTTRHCAGSFKSLDAIYKTSNSYTFIVNCLRKSIMKKIPPVFACILLFTALASAQQKTKVPEKAPVNSLQKLLSGIKLPITVVNDSLAVIPYEGENISSYQVVVQKMSDMFIIYTNLSEALPGKIDESKHKFLLEQNHHFDVVKIGLSTANVVYVRADVYKNGATTALLTRIIKQVANVTNIIGGSLK